MRVEYEGLYCNHVMTSFFDCIAVDPICVCMYKANKDCLIDEYKIIKLNQLVKTAVMTLLGLERRTYQGKMQGQKVKMIFFSVGQQCPYMEIRARWRETTYFKVTLLYRLNVKR